MNDNQLCSLVFEFRKLFFFNQLKWFLKESRVAMGWQAFCSQLPASFCRQRLASFGSPLHVALANLFETVSPFENEIVGTGSASFRLANQLAFDFLSDDLLRRAFVEFQQWLTCDCDDNYDGGETEQDWDDVLTPQTGDAKELFGVGKQSFRYIDWIIRKASLTYKQINFRNENYNGWTPLICCCANNNAKGVECLLKNGANPNMKNSSDEDDDDGCTPLSFSLTCGRYYLDCARLLLKFGANVDAKSCGQTVLQSLIDEIDNNNDNDDDDDDDDNDKKVLQCISLLIEFGANFIGFDLLHLAVKRRAMSIVELLLTLDNGIDDICCQDYSGYTALHYAIENNHLQMVQRLIAVDCNLLKITTNRPDKQDDCGMSVVEMAVQFGSPELLQWLIDRGAPVQNATAAIPLLQRAEFRGIEWMNVIKRNL
jgi:ankyrin repeat protein